MDPPRKRYTTIFSSLRNMVSLQKKRYTTLFVIIPLLSAYTMKTTVPGHPRDILPVLPRQVSWAILKSLKNTVDILPTYVGSASPGKPTLAWKGACFRNTTAWMEFHNKSGGQFGGGTLHIDVEIGVSWTCTDVYIFATPFRVTFDYYYFRGKHTLEFHQWEGKDEYEHVKSKGVSIFLMEAGLLGTLKGLYDVYPLFSNSQWGEGKNLDFLKEHMKASFNERPQPWITTINVDDVHSGDFIAISKIRGRWGGFQTLQKWVTGAYAGHTAVFLKDPEGKLFVAESGRENEKRQDIIDILPWEEWWGFELNKDDANPHIALLPLRSDIRAKFNEAAAWEYARSRKGKPYGFHNLIFSWIDTEDRNYPSPVNAHLVACFMTFWSNTMPAKAAKMWNEALNKRLGTTDLDLASIIVETENRGMSFGQLLTIPEQDSWVYSDGKSTTCVVFVMQMYKEAGLFEPIASSSIQATEFTVKDAYTLNLFENDTSRLPNWCNGEGSLKLPFCQILGKYRMELPGYNTMNPYPHMNERCPTLPPDYKRVPNC